MARTDDDSWDLSSSVGATATMVAAARAMAMRDLPSLVDDPFAAPLVQAVGVDFFTRLATGHLDPGRGDCGNNLEGLQRLTEVLAVRTQYFDEFVTDAADAGIRQIVILASGLDTRAYRLSSPPDTTVFEVDQPAVITFKSATLARLGAHPAGTHRLVPADLRQDWPVALQTAGFNAKHPTAWLAEGLLGYLPATSESRLLEDITALSCLGSRFAADRVPLLPDSEQAHFRDSVIQLLSRWRAYGFDVEMTDMVYLDKPVGLVQQLQANGWQAAAISTSELFTAHGVPAVEPTDYHRAPFAVAEYITATLTDSATVEY
jgi:methyltransferase (TIGR00027 family)